MRITLDFHLETNLPVDASGLLPKRVLPLPFQDVERLPLGKGNLQVALRDCCQVVCEVDADDELVFTGGTDRLVNVGSKMDAGRLVVQGNVNRCAGLEMSGGELVISGNAGDYLGAALQGGVIRVSGNAGDYCGAGLPGHKEGMCGGMILVAGNAGAETGANMRRGLLAVWGSCGEYAAANLRAGTIIICGTCGKNAGLGMRRGSLVTGKLNGPMLAGFLPAGHADVEWLRVYWNKLNELGMRIPKGWMGGKWLRFTGDRLSLGKGEVLVYEHNE